MKLKNSALIISLKNIKYELSIVYNTSIYTNYQMYNLSHSFKFNYICLIPTVLEK